MKKIKTKCGHIAYLTTRAEISKLGGFGICDSCNQEADAGYLIPVMNRWLCPACYKKWNERATFYLEDLPIEKKNADFYESMIPLEGLM
ncbi:MAG: hypothetical protein ACOWWH_07195 [Eubacteriaceae bacterium]